MPSRVPRAHPKTTTAMSSEAPAVRSAAKNLTRPSNLPQGNQPTMKAKPVACAKRLTRRPSASRRAGKRRPGGDACSDAEGPGLPKFTSGSTRQATLWFSPLFDAGCDLSRTDVRGQDEKEGAQAEI